MLDMLVVFGVGDSAGVPVAPGQMRVARNLVAIAQSEAEGRWSGRTRRFAACRLHLVCRTGGGAAGATGLSIGSQDHCGPSLGELELWADSVAVLSRSVGGAWDSAK